MKQPFSPLVWLCAASMLILGALTIYDPGGVYAGYASQLDAGIPPIAAVFTAVQDGIYPWTVITSSEEIVSSPAFRLLTDTVTDEEMRSSVGNEDPFPDPLLTSASPPVLFTPSVEIILPETPDENPAEGEPAPEEKKVFLTVDESWFDDALFIGDSHIEGFCDYGGLYNATYYFKRGLDIWSVMKKAFVGGKQTIPQALSEQQFGKIYIMLGINEIGCGTTDSYAEQYANVVAQLRELQPDAVIYIQSIFHTSQRKSDATIYNNDTINARNEAISQIADGERVFYLDCNVVFDDENGALTASYTGDGVHVMAPYYTMWRDFLLQHGTALPESSANLDPDSASALPAPGTEVTAAAPGLSAPAAVSEEKNSAAA